MHSAFLRLNETHTVSDAALRDGACFVQRTHMDRRFIAYKEANTVAHRNACSKPNATPARIVIETGKGVVRVVSWSHDQERDADAKPANDVEDEEHHLHRR